MKAAVAGLGRMGMRHLQVLRGLGLEISAAADMQEDLRKVREQHGACRADATIIISLGV